MASTFTTSLRIDQQGTGDNDGTWGVVANNQFALFDAAIASVATIGLLNGDNSLSTANGTADQARNSALKLTGVLTSAATVIVPDLPKQYVITNLTTGGQTITVRNSAGTGIVVPASSAIHVFCDGTSVRAAAPISDYSGNVVFGSTVNFDRVICSTIQAAYVTTARVNATIGVSTSILYVHAGSDVSTLNARGLATFVNMDVSGTVSAQTGILNNATVKGVLGVSAAASITQVSAQNINVLNRITTQIGVGNPVTVAYAANVTVDFALGNNFIITPLTGNLTLQNPVNGISGQSGSIFLFQDGTGGRTITYGTSWLFEGGNDPVMTATSGARDVLTYFITSAGAVYSTLLKDFR